MPITLKNVVQKGLMGNQWDYHSTAVKTDSESESKVKVGSILSANTNSISSDNVSTAGGSVIVQKPFQESADTVFDKIRKVSFGDVLETIYVVMMLVVFVGAMGIMTLIPLWCLIGPLFN